MKPILILYATREGHTRKVAEHLAAAVRTRGHAAEVLNVAALPDAFSVEHYSAAFVAASVHQQHHEPEMVAFVRKHKDELERVPAVFLSISLTETTAEDPSASPEKRAKAAADVDKMIQDFLADTGWHPAKVTAAAGALLYSKYNFLIRFIMRRIAQKAGGDTDTSRDYEYTDWEALDRLVDEVVADGQR
jgi:menaquinone-dependent protoporphyrinogen oxidase